MARWIYTSFFYLIMPVILLRLLFRSIKAPAYARRIPERLGLISKPDFESCIWIHAVSVGETIAAEPLVKYLLQYHRDQAIVVTTMTPTGSDRVKALFGEKVHHFYAPYDLPGATKRFIRRINPKILIIMETELWPNTIHYCSKNNTSVIVANARLSEKSANGYRRLASLSRSMLRQISIVAAQYEMDGKRFVELGLPSAQLSVTGSIKFDVNLPAELKTKAMALRSELQCLSTEQGIDDDEIRTEHIRTDHVDTDKKRKIFLAASTHEGEDELIIDAFKAAESDNLLLILVPRHPERFSKVISLCKQSGLETLQRSLAEPVQNTTQVLVGDTMGELLLFCGCADIAFIGGSLTDNGGHNMLEAAAWGVPILSGSSVYNFLEISERLQQANAMKLVMSGEELTTELNILLTNPVKCEQMGQAALQVVEQNRGALGRLLAIIDQTLNQS